MILQGVRVIEIGQILAGPFVGAIMADLGAEVIKIEKPDGGDDGRQMGPAFLNGDSLTFHEFNRGKRSVILDLKTEEGIAQLKKLAAHADILVHNMRPGVPEKLGIEADRLCALYPRLIYCEISGFGHSGPMRFDPAFEPLIQAFSGLVSINGDPSAPPSRLPISAVDLGTAMWTVIGALAALRQRDQTERGCVIRTSLFETALSWGSQRINALVNEGVEMRREPASGHAGMVPYQAFETSDGSLFICAGNDRLFAKTCSVLQHEDWAKDTRFATNRQRIANREALVGMMQTEIGCQPRAFWLEKFKAAGVPCSPVNSIQEVVASEQIASVDLLTRIPGAEMQLVATPISFDGERCKPASPAPRLGQHNSLYL